MEVLDFLARSVALRHRSPRARSRSRCSGAFCGALGFWVVTEQLSYAAESLSHGLLPGLVLAALAGAPLLLGAAAGALVAALLIALAARDERIGPETGTAVAVTGLIGLGALLALAPDSPQRLEELLFGDPLGVTDADLVAAAALLVLGGLAARARSTARSARCAFDSDGAAALGLRPRLMRARACSRCWRSPSRWPYKGLARSSCWPCWWRRPWRCGVTRALAGRAMLGGAARGGAGGRRRASTSPSTRAAPPGPRWRSRCAPPPRSGALVPTRAAGRGAFRRASTIATPSASSARLISWGRVRPATTESLRRMNSTRKRSTPARIR